MKLTEGQVKILVAIVDGAEFQSQNYGKWLDDGLRQWGVREFVTALAQDCIRLTHCPKDRRRHGNPD